MVIWKPDRSREQGLLVASMYQQAQGVPCDRLAVVAGRAGRQAVLIPGWRAGDVAGVCHGQLVPRRLFR